MVDLALRKKLFNLCDPNVPVESDNPAWVDLDAHGARGENWQDKLASTFELADRNKPQCIFFSGLRGSGKSTELLRLKQRLEDKAGANLRVVYIKAEDSIDLAAEIDVPDILISVLSGVAKNVAELEGKDPKEALNDGYLGRLWRGLQTEVEVKGAGVQLGPFSMDVEMRYNPTFRKKVRDRLAQQLSTFVREIGEELTALEAKVLKRKRQGLVVIFDSLEKLRGTSTNWEEVIGSAEQVFSGQAPHIRLPVHVIYTVPPALLLRMAQKVEFMPMLKLRDKQGQLNSSGYQTAQAIIDKRMTPEEGTAIFGADYEAAVKAIIEWSGGYPREMISLLQKVVQRTQYPVTSEHVKHLLSGAGDDYRRAVTLEEARWLAKVAQTGILPLENQDDIRIADHVFQNSLIFRYRNATEWYQIHPALNEHPEIKKILGQPSP